MLRQQGIRVALFSALAVALLPSFAGAQTLTVTLTASQPGTVLMMGMAGDPLPLAVGYNTVLTATASGTAPGTTEYQFIVYWGPDNESYFPTSYTTSNTKTFMPAAAGTYHMRVLARRGSVLAQADIGPYYAPLIVKLTSQPASGAALVNNTVTWSAAVTGIPSGSSVTYNWFESKNVPGAIGTVNFDKSQSTFAWKPTEAGSYKGQVRVKAFKNNKEAAAGFASFSNFQVVDTDPSVLTWTSQINATNFPALTNTSLVTPGQRILIEGKRLSEIVSSVTIVRDNNEKCSQCHHFASQNPLSAYYRPNVQQNSTTTISPTQGYDAGGVNRTWVGLDGFADKFILRDETASYGQKPLFLRELMKRWKAGGYRQ